VVRRARRRRPVWDETVFTKKRDRPLDAEVAAKLMGALLAHRETKLHLSSDHFSVDGTLIEKDATKATSRAEHEAAIAMAERHDSGAGHCLTRGATRATTRVASSPNGGACA
jgi:hypothetical protein